MMAEQEQQNNNKTKQIGLYTVSLASPVQKNQSVFIAEKNPSSEKQHACKIIPLCEMEEDEQKVKELQEKLFQIQDITYLVKLRDIHQTQDNLYIFMKLYKEGSLQDLLTKSNFFLPEEQILNLMYHILEGYISRQSTFNILGDLNPDNIVLYKGKPRLCAFGINRKIDDKINEPNLKDLIISQFRSPQRLLKEPYTNKADIYNLGVIFYYMLYGCYPIKIMSIQKISQAFKDLKQSGPENAIKFPVRLDGTKPSLMIIQVIRRMLEYAEKDRISFEQLQNHLVFKNILKSHTASKNIITFIQKPEISCSKIYFQKVFEFCSSLQMIILDLRKMIEPLFVGIISCNRNDVVQFSVNLTYFLCGSIKFCKQAMMDCKKPQDGIPYDPAFYSSKSFLGLFIKIVNLEEKSITILNDYLKEFPAIAPQPQFQQHNFSTGVIFQTIKTIFKDCIQVQIESMLGGITVETQDIYPIYVFFKKLFHCERFNMEITEEINYKKLKQRKFDEFLKLD